MGTGDDHEGAAAGGHGAAGLHVVVVGLPRGGGVLIWHEGPVDVPATAAIERQFGVGADEHLFQQVQVRGTQQGARELEQGRALQHAGQ